MACDRIGGDRRALSLSDSYRCGATNGEDELYRLEYGVYPDCDRDVEVGTFCVGDGVSSLALVSIILADDGGGSFCLGDRCNRCVF